MPEATQEMLDAINASTPNWKGKVTRINYFLGSDFDKFLDPKWLFEPMPEGMMAEYKEKLKAAQPAILASLIDSHVQVHGDNPTAVIEEFNFNDSYKK
jgi:hypothetical protein